MNPAAAIALVAAALNLGAAALHLAIARAPGWREARAFALIALSAGAYNASSVVFCVGGFADDTSITVARFSYFFGHLNGLGWCIYAFGGATASWRRMPPVIKWGSGASLAIAVVFLLSGWALQPRVDVVDIPWAGVRYRYPLTTPVGDLYAVFVLGQFVLTLAQLIRRRARGEDDLGFQVVAFVVFLASAVAEALVAHRQLEFVSPGDLGVLIVVLPITVRVVRRFIADARRLSEYSGSLAGQVHEQTLWRDRAQVALVESDRMAALGRLAAGVGHEINNPLTYLTLSLTELDEYLAATHAPAPVLAAASHAKDGATRIQKVAERLRGYARRHDERALLDLRDVVAAAVKVAGPHVDPVARVEFDLQPMPRVLGDESRLVQAVVNLLINAAQAVAARPGAGSILVQTCMRSNAEAVVAVVDDGSGIPLEHMGRLTEPYFTTRADIGGLGLGLFVTRGIVDDHHGRITFNSETGRGTTVCITLPGVVEALSISAGPVAGHSAVVPIPSGPATRVGHAPRDPAAGPLPVESASAPPSPTAAISAKPTVLIVDDEPLVVRLLATVIKKTWDVTTATNGAEALDVLASRTFDVILCDLMMPGMSGIELAGHVGQRDPGLRRRMMFLTGGAVTEEAGGFLARPDVQHLTKPIDRAELLAALDRTAKLRG